VNIDVGYTNPRWYVDGRLVGTGTGITVNAVDYGVGGHTLSLMVDKDGVAWSKEIAFTVEAGTLRTVIFRINDGIIHALKTLTSPATTIAAADFPANPTRTGYDFTGWNTQANGGGTPFTSSTTVDNDTTVYAQWNPHTYTVTFKPNGAAASDITKTVIVPATTIADFPADLSRSGYNFAGWNTQADGSGTSFTASTPVSASITVYAQWALTQFDITLNLDAGDGAFSQNTFTINKNGGTSSQTLSITGGYTNPRWFVDGEPRGTETSIEIQAADYSLGGHTLSLFINKSGVSWSKEITFTVEN
jgi:uncharacterized repeat protein (TIGR02543 family)